MAKPKRDAVAFTFWISRTDLTALRASSVRTGDPVAVLLRRGARLLLDAERRPATRRKGAR